MKTKVVLDYRGSSHWLYTVYVLHEDANKWQAVQTFNPKERIKAINYAKDISRLSVNEVDTTIWTNE